MYAAIQAQIRAVLEADASIPVVLDAEPKAVSIYPAAYLLLMGSAREYAESIVTITYQTRVRLLFPITDTTAETRAAGYVNTLPAAFDSVFGLWTSDVRGSFFELSQTWYRGLDVMVSAREVLPIGQG